MLKLAEWLPYFYIPCWFSVLQLACIGGLWCCHGYSWSVHLWPHHNKLHLSRCCHVRNILFEKRTGVCSDLCCSFEESRPLLLITSVCSVPGVNFRAVCSAVKWLWTPLSPLSVKFLSEVLRTRVAFCCLNPVWMTHSWSVYKTRGTVYRTILKSNRF